MYSTELLLSNNQKGSTCYPMTLIKRDSVDDIFLEILNFFGQAISKNSSKLLIVKVFYFIRMSDDYCFCGTPEKWDPGP